MSFSGYPVDYDTDEEYYEETSPWVLERDIGKGGFGLVKLYINQVCIYLTTRSCIDRV